MKGISNNIQARTRAQSVNFSPCHSSNSKYMNNLDPYTHNTAVEEPQRKEEMPVRFVSISEKKMKNRNPMATLGSQDCPPSPSPICSPVSFISCSPPTEFYYSQFSTDFSLERDTTRNESSCMMNEDEKSPSILEEVKQKEKKEEMRQDLNSLNITQLQSSLFPRSMMRGRASVGRKEDGDAKHEHRHKAKSVRTIRRRLDCEHDKVSSIENVSMNYKEKLVEEEELEQEITLSALNEGKSKNVRRAHLGLSILSQEIQPSPNTGYDGSCGSRCESSDTESAWVSSIRSGKRLPHVLMADLKRKEMKSNLMAWKERETSKLMNELSRKESAITEWELKEKTKARTEMKNIEKKFEKKREDALEKMKRRIVNAQKKADEMKLRERAATLQKISNVSDIAEKIQVTGKLPWKLLCF